jgi:hypothetical protein
MLVLSAKQNNLIAKSRTVDTDDEHEERLEAVLNHVCGDLNENVLDTENDHIIDLSLVRRKKKSNNAKNLKKANSPRNLEPQQKLL